MLASFAFSTLPIAYSLPQHILYNGFVTMICLSICKVLIAGLQYYPLLGQGQRFPINDPSLLPHMSPRPGECTLHTSKASPEPCGRYIVSVPSVCHICHVDLGIMCVVIMQNLL